MVCVPGEAGDGRVCALARACRQRCNCTDAAAAAPPARAPPPPPSVPCPAAGRYHLYVSLACPWACRCVAVMHMKVGGRQAAAAYPGWQCSLGGCRWGGGGGAGDVRSIYLWRHV